MRIAFVSLITGCLLASSVSAHAQTRKCPPDSVPVGPLCVDKYEASVWRIVTANTSLVKKVMQGKATLADLQKFTPKTGVGVQLGCTAPPYNMIDYDSIPSGPGSFPPDGNWVGFSGVTPPSPGVFAVSIPGVLPSACITWFQAEQACALVGKRLLTNQEWQRAAAGTPRPANGVDDGLLECNIFTARGVVDAGSRANCVSSWGVFDMVGNVAEWVADWVDKNTPTNCGNWNVGSGLLSNGTTCFGPGGDSNHDALPAALVRGDKYQGDIEAGVFALSASVDPTSAADQIGFRCAR